MARLPYVDPSDLPADRRDLLDTLDDGDVPTADERSHSLRGGTLNVYRVLGQNPDLLEAFRSYAGAAWDRNGLSTSERESVILATAYHAGSAYEWHQHVRVALDAGVEPAEILAISREEPDRLPSERTALVTYVERFVDGRVTDETHERLAAHYDDRTVVGVGMLSGSYLGLARVIDALDVELETEFVGWELENL